jgi:hypothetical protein
MPEARLKNVQYPGVEQIPGIKRKPQMEDSMRDLVRNEVWRAAQLWRDAPHTFFGQDVILPKLKIGKWTPDVMHWAQTMCDANTDLKNAKVLNDDVVSGTQKADVAVQEQLVCFYGHKATSSVNAKGTSIWRRAPKTPWPDVPAGRVLCQKCYEAHRVAAKNNQSQGIIDRLYIHKRNESDTRSTNNYNQHQTTTSTQQASKVPMSTELRTDDAEDGICDICAFDILEHNVIHEREITWYRLAFTIYPDNARPPGSFV